MNDISSENKDVTLSKVRKPLKKAHIISDKVIVVIDDALVKRLAIDEDDTWFEQSEADNGIFLRVRRMNIVGDR